MDVKKYKTLELGKGEKIIAEVRKHWFSLFLESASLIGFLILPFLFRIIVNSGLGSNLIAGNANYLILGFSAGSLLMGWVMFFFMWTDYYLDIWVITNKRIIDIEQKGFFNRDIATLSVNKIQDVRISTEGFFATIIGYGTIRVQTAGTNPEFKIVHIPNPNAVKDAILKASHQYEGQAGL